MTSAKPWQPPRLFAGRRWAVGMAIVLAIAVVQAVPAVLKGSPPGRLALQLGVWVLTTPAQMLLLSIAFDRATAQRNTPMRTVVELLFIAIGIGAVFTVGLVHVIRDVFQADIGTERAISYPLAAAFGAVLGVMMCGIWALAFVYPHAAEQSRLRALEAERLTLEADQLRASAELARLRSQIEPHFLLNTLNAIAGLVTQDPKEARRLIANLGDLLRDSLDEQGEMQALSQEVRWLNRYAEILEARHGEAVRFVWEIADDTRSLLVPRLLLQPLVENAVKHGALQRRDRVGSVTVKTRLEHAGAEPTLICMVCDNGPGLDHVEPRANAFGLRAVRRRLELKYPSARLRLEATASGTSAIVELPIVREPALAATSGAP